MLDWLRDSLRIVHALAGAAWFGSMFYSLMVLQPGVRRFFDTQGEREAFVATVSHGGRQKILLAIFLVAATGLLLCSIKGVGKSSGLWLGLIITKALLTLGALGLFAYGSWVLWPARILASSADMPGFQRRFRLLGMTILLLVAVAFAAGIVANRV